MIVDLTENEARVALPCKWGVPEGVLPAWIAEMDYRLAPAISETLHAAIDASVTGYPPFGDDAALGAAYAGFAQRRYGQVVDPEQVQPTVDVTAGVRLALDVLSDPGPMVMPMPGYPPQHAVAEITGRDRVDLVVDPDAERAEIDLDRLATLFEAGARTLLLTQPHNPWGRAFTRAELEGIRDVVLRYGARVISDEIHAPLVLPGAEHVPYLSLEGTGDHAVSIVAASKAFNVPGLRCAQIVTNDADTMRRLRSVPMVRNDSWSTLGVIGSIAAYTDGDAWLDALLHRLDQQRTLLADLLAEHLPLARMRPLEATFLAWLDLRGYGHDSPAGVLMDSAKVMVSPGHDFMEGLPGHIRLNIATSPERLTEIILRMGAAL